MLLGFAAILLVVVIIETVVAFLSEVDVAQTLAVVGGLIVVILFLVVIAVTKWGSEDEKLQYSATKTATKIHLEHKEKEK
jgi:uncharacterized MnhB-related membrane protein